MEEEDREEIAALVVAVPRGEAEVVAPEEVAVVAEDANKITFLFPRKSKKITQHNFIRADHVLRYF